VSKASRHIVILLCSFLLCLALGVGIYGVYVEPSRLEVRHVWINDHEMGQMLQKKVVVQISDIHLHTIGSNETRLLKTIDTLQPDLIFLTGDYVRWNGAYEEALDFLAKVKAKDGVWAVMGDYDYSNSRKSCLFCHAPNTGRPTKRHDIKFLRNSPDKIDTPAGPVWIVGLDREADGGSFSEENLSFLKGKVPAIILSHSPLTFDLIGNNQNVLMLSGDTHGGQIPLPSWLWRLMGYEKNARYEQGWFEKGKKKMYVTQGVGTSHFPIRLFRRPEITVFHFEESLSR
jgi:predicted MPP superfamily phosphohydrolase